MAENLKTTKYRNGETIANVTDGAAWAALSTGAYCCYNNDVANKAVYGGLYNWYAVADARNIAPSGWHVPTDSEWTTLTTYLGSESIAGGKLKETGTAHWYSPNVGATNASGFTALPGGGRLYNDGTFHGVGGNGYWWSSTEGDAIFAWGRYFGYGSAHAYLDYDYKQYGFSVRCIQD